MGSLKQLVKFFVPDGIANIYRKKQRDKFELQFKGENVFCPICQSKFKHFAPYGIIQRENATCIKCGSQERHRLLWKYLHEKTNLYSDKQIKLLHFAPEKLFYDNFSNTKNIDYVPCDLFPETFKYSGAVAIHKVDITSIPFKDNSFDVIVCSHVLEHIPDDKKAMSELYRVLKPGGWGVFQVPIDYNREKTYEDFSITDPLEREKAFGQIDHVRWYGRDYADRLRAAGFNVKADDFVLSFSDEEIFKYGFMKSELIYYCTKL